MHARLLLLVLVAVLPALAIIVNTGIEQSREAMAATERLARSTARQLATRQRDMLKQAHEALQGLALAPEVRQLRSTRDCNRWLTRVATLGELYADLFVADSDGRLLCSTRPFRGEISVADRAYFRRAMERRDFAIGDFSIGRVTGKPAIVFAQPVFGAHDEITAIVAIAATPELFVAQLRELALPDGAVVTILDAQGVILARLPDPDGIAGRTIPELAEFRAATVDASEVVTESVWLDGIARVSAIVPVLSTHGDLYVRVGIPSAMAEVAVTAVARHNVLLLLGAAALVLVFGGVAAQYLVVRRVRDLAETVRRRHAEELVHQANHDALTDLPNRNLLADRLQQTLARAAGNTVCFVLWLDVDRFKVVHDSFGREAADAALADIARRLAAAAQGCSTVARVASDEFVLIADQLPGQQAVVSLVSRLLEAMREPLVVGGEELRLSASIGVAEGGGTGQDADALLRNACVAMNRAKETGRDTFSFYDADMNARAAPRLRLELELRRAIERHELYLVYQPKVDLLTGEVSGCEALCRWRHVELGMVSPGEFIPVAEESGLILPIGRWVLETAGAQMREWLDAGIACPHVAVNVSALQFLRDDLVADVSALLSRHRLDAAMLMLEITESTLMRDPERAIATMRGLKAIGVRLAIDDFGTGYSSLGTLKRFPIDYLKIDRAFVTDLTTNASDAAIAVSIISLAHCLNLRVTAEGVETEGQLLYLRGRGCDEMQGYHFSPPLPPAAFAELLADGRGLALPVQKDLSERTLLLVDDEPSIQSALRRILRREGYTLLFAGSAAEAFELLARHAVGVVISEVRMPGMDGVHFLDQVRGLYPHTVRLILSGYADVGMITGAINRGAIFRFLHKPWDDRELLEAVRDAFERFELGMVAVAA